MRYLIDGYNLMYAGGLLGRRLGSERFRKARTRFLNDLADALGPVDAYQTTVVFDAAAAPEAFPPVSSHQGLTVVYAVDDDSADARIEHLIARHATPKTLTVVSSDRRIRQAAARRKSAAVTAEDFWVTLDSRRELPRHPRPAPPVDDRPADRELSPDETEHWLREFGDLDDRPETREALGTDNIPLLTDSEIAELEREIDREPG